MTKHVHRRKAVAAITAGIATVAMGLTYTSAAGAAPAASQAGTAVPANLKLIKTKTSLLGKHLWYQQTFKGLPVINGYYAQHVDKSGKVVQISDGRDAVPANLDVSAKVPSATATKSANTAVTARAARSRNAGGKDVTPTPAATQGAAQLAVIGGPDARLVWNVTSRSTEGVDAKPGRRQGRQGRQVRGDQRPRRRQGLGVRPEPGRDAEERGSGRQQRQELERPVRGAEERHPAQPRRLRLPERPLRQHQGGQGRRRVQQEQQLRLPARERQVRAGRGVLPGQPDPGVHPLARLHRGQQRVAGLLDQHLRG